MSEYVIPASRLPGASPTAASNAWRAGLGVPGGRPLRATVYHDNGSGVTSDFESIDNTGSTNVVSAINTIIAACTNGLRARLPEGIFRCDSPVTMSYGKQVTLGGTLDVDGTLLTTIDQRGGKGVQIGSSYNLTATPVSIVVASLTKGATTIQVSSSASFAVGQLCYIQFENNPILPVFSNYPQDYLQTQWVRIAGKPDGTHYTIEAPGLLDDYTSCPTARLISDDNNFWSTGMGIEDLIVDGANSGGTMQVGFNFDNSYGSWLYNVEAKNYLVYGVQASACYRCEVRYSVFDEAPVGVHTAGGGIFGSSTLMLFIHNIVKSCDWMFFVQTSNSGHGFLYNLFVNTRDHSAPFLTNHAPWINFNLLEGNILMYIQSDGYHGGEGNLMCFRNFFMGTDLAYPTGGGAAYLRRETRYATFIGNQLGRAGLGTGISYGSPNLGNSNDLIPGHTSRACVSSLTTRTNATSGTITAPSGHGVTTGAVIDICWTEEESGYYIIYGRRGVTVGTVSGTSIPFSGGNGRDLPASSSTIYVPTSNQSIVNWWGDWDVALGKPKEYTGVLTTRTSDSAGVITLTAGQGTDFAAQWARAFAGQRGIQWGGSKEPRFITVTGVVGDVVSFSGSYSHAMPVEGTAVILTPGNFGFQEVDIDVWFTALQKGNWYANVSSPGIPAEESLAGQTLPDSLVLSGPDQQFIDAGCAWPPVVPGGSFVDTYDIIPAGKRFGALVPNTVPEFISDVVISGSGFEGTTITVSAGAATGTPAPTYAFQLQLNNGGGYADVVGATTAPFIFPDYVAPGYLVRMRKTATNTEGSDISYSNAIEITPFMGDIYSIPQVSNSAPVIELWSIDGVEQVFTHSGDYPAGDGWDTDTGSVILPNNGATRYNEHGPNNELVYIFDATIVTNLSEAIAARDAL